MQNNAVARKWLLWAINLLTRMLNWVDEKTTLDNKVPSVSEILMATVNEVIAMRGGIKENLTNPFKDGLVNREVALNMLTPEKEEAFKSNTLTKDTIIKSVIKIEAGYVNHSLDRGGETNLGITKAVADVHSKALKSQFGWDGNMRNLTVPMAEYIYLKDYWDRLRLDDIAKHSIYIADKLFEVAVNVGTARAGRWVQEILNVLNRNGKDYKDIKADGIVGSGTITAFDAFMKINGSKKGANKMITGVFSSQGRHYIDISLAYPDNEAFTNGWFERQSHNVAIYVNALK